MRVRTSKAAKKWHAERTAIAEVSMAINSLNELKRVQSKRRKLSENQFGKFKEIAALLSSLLPKPSDKTLFEVDDLLYPNDDKRPSSSTRSKGSNEFLIVKCFEPFHYIYTECNKMLPVSCILDTTYLQLIEYSTDEVFKLNYASKANPVNFIEGLIENKTATDTCRAIKFLKVALNNHRAVVQSTALRSRYFETFLRLSKITNIPEAKQEQTKRLTNWLSHQSSKIFGKFSFKSHDEDVQEEQIMLKKLEEKCFDQESVELIDRCSTFEWIGCLYKFFSSAKNDDEKLKRVKDYLKAFLPENEVTSTTFLIYSSDRICNNILSSFFLSFRYIKCPNTIMQKVDKYHRNDLEPFITESANYSNDDNASNDLQMSDNIKGSTNPEDTPDFTIEKFIIYDDFLKKLYLLWKLHNILKNCKEHVETEGEAGEWEGVIFRSKGCFGIRFLNSRLNDSSKCGDLPWWFDTMLSKCPFLFVSRRHEYLIGDLTKMLKGEEIDDATWEKLHYAVNESTYY